MVDTTYFQLRSGGNFLKFAALQLRQVRHRMYSSERLSDLSELTTGARSGTMTVEGTTTSQGSSPAASGQPPDPNPLLKIRQP